MKVSMRSACLLFVWVVVFGLIALKQSLPSLSSSHLSKGTFIEWPMHSVFALLASPLDKTAPQSKLQLQSMKTLKKKTEVVVKARSQQHSKYSKYLNAAYLSNITSERTRLQSLRSHQYLVSARGHVDPLLHYMQLIATQPQCIRKPLFVSMARVQSNLYWQLIRNFFSSMVVFGHIDCVVMICISDPECLRRCTSENFPCFDYVHPNATTAHIMEQVATVKLHHMSIALEAGINILLLDMDVGFLRDPLLLYEGFLEDPYEHVRAQMDLGTSWNKSIPTYPYEYTWPSPNFGCFLIKAHPHSVKLMQRAWREYQKATPVNKGRVATDQNAMVGAIKWARWRWDFNFSYFSIGFYLDTRPRPIIKHLKTFLLDKMVRIYKQQPVVGEMGGVLARKTLGDVIAVHATCYEKSIKLSGLRAANAFWDSSYYNPGRLTFTKPIMFLSKRSLREELKTIGYISWKTGRHFIMPNVLIGSGSNIQGTLSAEICKQTRNPALLSPFCAELRSGQTSISIQNQSFCALHHGEYYWPAWRTLFALEPNLPTVLEPGYYYRIERDMHLRAPDPVILPVVLNTTYAGKFSTYFTPTPKTSTDRPEKEKARENTGNGERPSAREDMANIDSIIEQLLSPRFANEPRIVLDVRHSILGPEFRGGPPLAQHDMITRDSNKRWLDGARAETVVEKTSREMDEDDGYYDRVEKLRPEDRINELDILTRWAKSSVSDWKAADESDESSVLPPLDPPQGIMASSHSEHVSYPPIPKYLYLPLPALGPNSFPAEFEGNYRLCWKFLIPSLGNRSCFGLCK